MEEYKMASVEEIKNNVADGLKDGIKQISEKVGEDLIPAEKKGALDVILEKVISRKLLVFGTATALMWYGLNPETWGLIAMCYIGGQSAIDMVNAWKWGK